MRSTAPKPRAKAMTPATVAAQSTSNGSSLSFAECRAETPSRHHQCLSFRLCGIGNYFAGLPLLDNSTRGHDRDPVGHSCHQRQIVGYKKISQRICGLE